MAGIVLLVAVVIYLGCRRGLVVGREQGEEEQEWEEQGAVVVVVEEVLEAEVVVLEVVGAAAGIR